MSPCIGKVWKCLEPFKDLSEAVKPHRPPETSSNSSNPESAKETSPSTCHCVHAVSMCASKKLLNIIALQLFVIELFFFPSDSVSLSPWEFFGRRRLDPSSPHLVRLRSCVWVHTCTYFAWLLSTSNRAGTWFLRVIKTLKEHLGYSRVQIVWECCMCC